MEASIAEVNEGCGEGPSLKMIEVKQDCSGLDIHSLAAVWRQWRIPDRQQAQWKREIFGIDLEVDCWR